MKLDYSQLADLEISIADRIYIQVSSWHLYLGDAKLAKALAMQCNAYLDNGAGLAARKALDEVEVPLGGGITSLPLSRLIPSSQVLDLEEILEPYCS